MADLITDIRGFVARTLIGAPVQGDFTPRGPRVNHRGDLSMVSMLTPDQAAAVEDSLYTFADQGTRDTGVALTSTTGNTYANTQALLLVVNTNPPGGPDVIMRRLHLKTDTVPGSQTYWQIYHNIDTGNRWSSAGNLLTGYNAAGAQPPGVLVYDRTVVCTAPGGNARDIGTNLLSNGVLVAQAQVQMLFGAQVGGQGLFTTETTGSNQEIVNAPAVVIHPGFSYVMNEYATSRATTAFTGELFVEMIVR